MNHSYEQTFQMYAKEDYVRQRRCSFERAVAGEGFFDIARKIYLDALGKAMKGRSLSKYQQKRKNGKVIYV